MRLPIYKSGSADYHYIMKNLKSITLTLTNPRKTDNWYSEIWKVKLASVGEMDDIPVLVFLGEVLKILDNSDDVTFESSCYEPRSVYGNCYEWTFRTESLTMSRDHRETLSDSWQRVEVLSNSFITEGFNRDFYIDWNGKFYLPVTITLGGITEECAESIKLVAKSIFRNHDSVIKDASDEEKRLADERRSQNFT